MQQEKQTIAGALILVLTILLLINIGVWYFINIGSDSSILYKFYQKKELIRFLYVLSIGCLVYLFPNKRLVNSLEEYIKITALLSMLFLGGIYILGEINIKIYDLFIYPILSVLYIIVTVFALSSLRNTNMFKKETIFGTSNVNDKNFYFDFTTTQGDIRIHRPQQNTYIDGGAGSGKTMTLIASMIDQACERNYAGVIYDWEGDPSHKENSMLLTKVAYGGIIYHKSKLKFSFINFVDMEKTARVNVLSAKYIPAANASLYIKNIITALMKNLEPSWKEKTDFWANNAINLVYSVAYKCYKDQHLGINTLPHVIALCLNDVDPLLEWLATDEEIRLNMSSIIGAQKKGADQQLAGTISSAQTPLVLLNNKNIFWVLSGGEEELNLDVTNPNNPTLLCIGNSPSLKEAISPAISTIFSIIMSQMNQPNKVKSIFCIDEFSTVLIHGIDTFISTARKHFVATILALQDFNQAVLNYGEKRATIIKATCGNMFFGMTGNNQTARELEELLGEKKEEQHSYTLSDEGSDSQSQSLQKEKVINRRDIAGQKVGHFIGKIANGEPPFFKAQFNLEVGHPLDVPKFSTIIETGEHKKNTEITNQVVQDNYEGILRECRELLENYSR